MTNHIQQTNKGFIYLPQREITAGWCHIMFLSTIIYIYVYILYRTMMQERNSIRVSSKFNQKGRKNWRNKCLNYVNLFFFGTVSVWLGLLVRPSVQSGSIGETKKLPPDKIYNFNSTFWLHYYSFRSRLEIEIYSLSGDWSEFTFFPMNRVDSYLCGTEQWTLETPCIWKFLPCWSWIDRKLTNWGKFRFINFCRYFNLLRFQGVIYLSLLCSAKGYGKNQFNLLLFV